MPAIGRCVWVNTLDRSALKIVWIRGGAAFGPARMAESKLPCERSLKRSCATAIIGLCGMTLSSSSDRPPHTLAGQSTRLLACRSRGCIQGLSQPVCLRMLLAGIGDGAARTLALNDSNRRRQPTTDSIDSILPPPPPHTRTHKHTGPARRQGSSRSHGAGGRRAHVLLLLHPLRVPRHVMVPQARPLLQAPGPHVRHRLPDRPRRH